MEGRNQMVGGIEGVVEGRRAGGGVDWWNRGAVECLEQLGAVERLLGMGHHFVQVVVEVGK